MDSESVAGWVASVIARRQDPMISWPKPPDMEFKAVDRGLPESFWMTYSAFANSDRGFIVLGVSRDGDGYAVSGVGDPDGIIRDIRDGLLDRGRVSADLIRGYIGVMDVDGKDLVIMEVPRAERHLRPVYVNGRVEDGTFRRGPEGDYLCTLDEVDSMVRRNDRILRWNHDFHLAYMECPDDGPDWDYRLSTRDTTWIGNIYNFLGRALWRFHSSIGASGCAEGAVREALLNALMNADYGSRGGVCVTMRPGTLTVSNPGDLRIPLEMAEAGGCSDPRNPRIARMLGLIGMARGEGKGVPRIISAWEARGLGRPEYVLGYGPPRVVLRFPLPSPREAEGTRGRWVVRRRRA